MASREKGSLQQQQSITLSPSKWQRGQSRMTHRWEWTPPLLPATARVRMLEFSRAAVLLFDSFLNLLGVNLFFFHVILNVLIFLKDRSVFFSSSSSRLTYFCFFILFFLIKSRLINTAPSRLKPKVIQRFFPQRIHKKITLLSAMTHQLSREIQKYFILILHKREGRGD